MEFGTVAEFESIRQDMIDSQLEHRSTVSDGSKGKRKGGQRSKRNHIRKFAIATRLEFLKIDKTFPEKRVLNFVDLCVFCYFVGTRTCKL